MSNQPPEDSFSFLDRKDRRRLLPHFFIVGERKCGTSSLFRYLMMHPDCLPGRRKEPDYFSGNQGFTEESWLTYLENFPLAGSLEEVSLLWPELDQAGILYEDEVAKKREPGRHYVTGDASANTFHLGNPKVLKQAFPEIRLIMVFRDPVERAFSQHRMYLRFQEEGRDLGRKIDSFEVEIQREMESPGGGEFLAPGRYIDNLRRWDEAFSPEQRLVIFLDDLERSPSTVMREVLSHLKLPDWDWPAGSLEQRYNQAPVSSIDPSHRALLQSWYQESDQTLSEYLNRPIPWRS